LLLSIFSFPLRALVLPFHSAIFGVVGVGVRVVLAKELPLSFLGVSFLGFSLFSPVLLSLSFLFLNLE
jgi:hypothetical protein